MTDPHFAYRCILRRSDATPQERDDANILSLAIQSGNVAPLAVLSDWSPARLAHALQVFELADDRYEEGRSAVHLILELAAHLARLQGGGSK